MKAPVYREKGHVVCKELIDTCFDQMREVKESCTTSLEITRGGQRHGFAIDNARKNLAIDTLIVQLRALKSGVKGW